MIGVRRGRRLAGPGSGLLVGTIAGGDGPLDQRQPSPHHLARQAEVIEPLGPIGVDPRGQHSLPFAGRPLGALKLFDHLGQPGSPVELGIARQVPPRLQKLLPSFLADRLYLGSPPLAGIAVDAGEQAPGAPLLPSALLEATADGKSAGPQSLEGDLHRAGREPCRGHELFLADGTRDLQVALDGGHAGLVGVGVTSQAGRKRVIGDEACVRKKSLKLAPALRRRPKDLLGARTAHLEAAPIGGQSLEVLSPLFPGARYHQREEHVVQLVWIPHVGDRLASDPRNRIRVEAAELPRLDGESPPQRHRAGAALADLPVLVEVGEGGSVQDLVREHAGLDGVDEVKAYGPFLEATHQRS